MQAQRLSEGAPWRYKENLTKVPAMGTEAELKEAGDRLRLIRYALGYGARKQAQFARMCKIHQQRWNNAEKGRNFLGRDDQRLLAIATGVQPDYAMHGIGAEHLPAKVRDGIARIEAEKAVRKPRRR